MLQWIPAPSINPRKLTYFILVIKVVHARVRIIDPKARQRGHRGPGRHSADLSGKIVEPPSISPREFTNNIAGDVVDARVRIINSEAYQGGTDVQFRDSIGLPGDIASTPIVGPCELVHIAAAVEIIYARVRPLDSKAREGGARLCLVGTGQRGNIKRRIPIVSPLELNHVGPALLSALLCKIVNA